MIFSSLKAKFKKNNDIVHAHNIPSAKAMKNASGKKILTIHGIYSQQIENLHTKTISKIATKYEKEALEWADVITVVSKDAFDYYKKLGLNVYHIPNSIDMGSLCTKSDRRYKKQIIFAGRLSSEKGIDVLCELIEILPSDINLIILGSGPKENLIKMVLFSFSIYLLSIQEAVGVSLSFLGLITPMGGLLLISAWLVLFFSVKKQG